MKFLFIGDYSNLHTTIARELRNMGHQADIVSDGCGYMNLHTDYFIKREKGFAGSFKYLFNLFNLLPKLKDYDAVQLINTNFLSLKPQKIKYFFDRIKEQNKSMFLTLAGNDYFYVKACHDARLFRYSEFKIGNQFSPGHLAKPHHLYGWISRENRIWTEYLFDNINGAMSVLPEYDMVAKPLLGDKVKFTNLPINFQEIPSQTISFKDDKVNIMVGMRSGVEDMKGTRILHKIANEIKEEFPEKVNIDLVQDVSLNEFLSRMSQSDIILDQLYAYSPAMTALYAMSLSKVAATGAQSEYYDYIGNPKSRPLFSLSPFDKDIKERLIGLINNRDEILKRGKEAKEIVIKNNDSKIVTQKFLDHWINNIN